MNIRKLIFSLIDRPKGKNSVLNALDDLLKIQQDRHYYTERKRELINRLENVAYSIPAYKDFNGCSLSEFPVLTKSTLRKNYNDFLNADVSQKEIVWVATSGSYGVPFRIPLTKEKKAHQLAEIIASGIPMGYDIGVKHMYIRSFVSKSKFKQLVQNEHYLGAMNLDAEFLSQARELLRKKKITHIIAFPSAITEVARYCINKGDTPSDFNIKGITTSSENLSFMQRKILYQTFGSPICSRYSTEELGVIANQYEAGGPFIVNSGNYIVEILDLNEDKPVSNGEVGRIVITDLFSYAFPLVRYEIGDLASSVGVTYDSFGHVASFSSLSGRTVQILYNTRGGKMVPLAFENMFEKHADILQFQVVQQSHNQYDLNIVTVNDSLTFRDQLLFDMKELVGADAIVTINIVEQLQKLPNGKRPFIINNYKPE